MVGRPPKPKAFPLLALALALAVVDCAGKGAGEAPDVVLITIDTWRHDASGFSGSGKVETPHMDRLAAAGTVFTFAHAHAVVTLPSHASILTGRFPYEHGVHDNARSSVREPVQRHRCPSVRARPQVSPACVLAEERQRPVARCILQPGRDGFLGGDVETKGHVPDALMHRPRDAHEVAAGDGLSERGRGGQADGMAELAEPGTPGGEGRSGECHGLLVARARPQQRDSPERR